MRIDVGEKADGGKPASDRESAKADESGGAPAAS